MQFAQIIETEMMTHSEPDKFTMLTLNYWSG